MNKVYIGLGIASFLLVTLVGQTQAAEPTAGKSIEIQFFYSTTCPHCRAEQPFLDDLQDKYKDIKVIRYSIYERENQELLRHLLEERKMLEYFGSVPITIVGSEVFLGFDNAEGIGRSIEAAVAAQLAARAPAGEEPMPLDDTPTTTAGTGIKINQQPLVLLAVSLGALDGFNVCSLGALVLILSLVLVLRSRRKVFLYGGLFILTTAVVYGLLIVFWHQLFSLLGQYLRLLDLTLGILGVVGAVYFFREYLRFRRYGPACQVGGARLIGRMAKLVERSFGSHSTALLVAGSILLFAAVVTMVEFPCSAAVPVMFAGVLAKSNLPGLAYLGYLGLYLLFYLIDELVVFGIAVWKLSLWMGKGKFVTYAALVQSLLLLLLGGYYLISFVR